ncbi:unnamed protein product [Parascedosporium putredinis]|uniref:Glutamine synthetase n=1 Tax=Parascedosporium putredinis TaxID=1442378 RepID=A0A9P1GVU6_9PEZI|nr:unnamed protein product [Parascedosporium putredinis]CAI7988305.1 unnamed protein product [Parascedosporium putredinis]
MASAEAQELTVESLPKLLENDTKVKLAGVDVDGILRGKLVSKKKFLSVAEAGFGFCSVIFGWDMHDLTYGRELKVSNQENGYRDIIAVPDLSSFRRIPWEDDVPFFLVSFFDPDTKAPVCACPRGLVKTMLERIQEKGYGAMAGGKSRLLRVRILPVQNPRCHFGSLPASYLRDNPPQSLPSLTEGMFGYSLTRPVHNQAYYYDVFETCEKFHCNIEGWHTESGPGVFEAALEFGELGQMADRASLFKYVVKSVSTKYGIIPCFMAKPRQGLPGNSGHMHISLWPDIAQLSDLGRHFLAGILDGLPDHRAASIRLIAPPTSKPGATRFEIRVSGADTNPHFVLAAILGLGWRGVEKKLAIPCPPLGKGEDVGGQSDAGERLARSLHAATERFMSKGSVAREVFGDDFVEHFGGTREHEIRLWNEAVTDWEVKRYIETV